MATFRSDDIPDLTDQTVVITGGSGDIGLATARAFAAAGGRVVLAVRDDTKGREAARRAGGTTEARTLDLASLDSIRAFVDGWQDPIDILVNNAAASTPAEMRRTFDGFELQFGTDHLGHFALTNLLLEHLVDRVVTVSSQAEKMGRLDLDDLAWERRGYKASRAYNTAKLANLLFTAELQRRLDSIGSPVRAEAAHPGFVDTGIYRESGFVAKAMVRLMAQSPEQGALPILFAAVADIPGNSFAGPKHLAHMRGAPELIGRSSTAEDPDLARRLWEASERLTGVGWQPGRAAA